MDQPQAASASMSEATTPRRSRLAGRRRLPFALGLTLALLVGAGSPASAKEEGIDTTFEKKEKVSTFWLLFAGGESYRMSPKVHDAHSRVWPFIRRGAKIHVLLDNKLVVKVTRGWKTKAVSTSKNVLREIRVSKEGDRLQINGREYLFSKSDATHVFASPKRVDGEGFGDPVKIAIVSITKVVRIRDTDAGVGLAQEDVLSIFKVEVGDTVAVFLGKAKDPLKGSFVRMTDKSAEFRLWTGRGWGDVRRLLRSQVTRVRPVSLEQTSRHMIGGSGAIKLKVIRTRRAAEGPLSLKISLSHSTEGRILTGLKLKINLGEKAGEAEAPAAEELISVPNLFRGESHAVTHSVIHVRYADAKVVPLGGELMSFKDERATPLVLAAIDAAPDLAATDAFYKGLGQSGDKQAVRFLLTRALYPPTRKGEEPADHARVARTALKPARKAVVEIVLSDLQANDDDVSITILSQGKLVNEAASVSTAVLDHRVKLIDFLGRLKGAIDADVGRQLFELYVNQPPLGQAIERALAFQPETLVGHLVEEVVPSEGVSIKERAERASFLLRALAPRVIDLLPAVLAGRGVDTASLKEAIKTHGEKDPAKAVDAAFEAIRASQVGKRRKAINVKMAKARKQSKAQDWGPALTTLEEILREQPEHAGALELLGPVLVGQAVKLGRSGDVGGAIELLEQAHKGGQTAAAAPLAELLLKALEVEAKGLVVRSKPRMTSEKLQDIAPNSRFVGTKVKDRAGWIEIVTRGGGKGYTYEGGGDLIQGVYVMKAAPPRHIIEGLVRRVSALDPSKKARADEIFGGYLAADAQRAYDAGRYGVAYAKIKEAANFAPNDPRMGLKFKAGFMANWVLILVLFLMTVVGSAVLVWLGLREKKERDKRKVAIEGTKNLEIDLFGGAGDDEEDFFGQPGDPIPGEEPPPGNEPPPADSPPPPAG